MATVFSTIDTIVAIATPPGRGGIGVVRVSGPESQTIVRRLMRCERPLRPRYATLAKIRDISSVAGDAAAPIDQTLVTYFPSPQSYTGEDVVEISAHGNPVVLRSIVDAVMGEGARLAEPGEFTLRAYLNGRIDLMQAEAVADLIEAVTPLQARSAFDQLQGTLTRSIAEIDAVLFDLIARMEASVDFPDEGYHFADAAIVVSAVDDLLNRVAGLIDAGRRGRMIRDGLQIVIVGAPNAGKSSLFNALAGASRAIVTERPGTTRDLVTEIVDVNGLRVTLVDTAGMRDTDDEIELEGVARARGAAAVSDLVLLVVDRSKPQAMPDLTGPTRTLVVASKSDLPAVWHLETAVEVSATTGAGIESLKSRIAEHLEVGSAVDPPSVTNTRHLALMEHALEALTRARISLVEGPAPEEFVLADLQEARAFFDEVTGRRTPDDVLAHIFERFCIGK